MNRTLRLLCAVVGLGLAAGEARPDWGKLTYSGSQPWWNIFARRYKTLTPEEERLQKFWHDYYDALRVYYAQVDRIDWAAYYKERGYQVSSCGLNGCGPKVARSPAPAPGPVPVPPCPVCRGPGCLLPTMPPIPPVPPAPAPQPVAATPPAPLPGPQAPKNPGPETRSADDFELFLERILEAQPRTRAVHVARATDCPNCPKQPPQLSEMELQALWADLADADAGRRQQALQRLAAAPQQSVPFLRTRCLPTVDQQARFARVIGDLDDPHLPTRERAVEELGKWGSLAGPAMRQAQQQTRSPVARRELDQLLEQLDAPQRGGEQQRRRLVAEVLKTAGTPEALRLLEAIR
jgi:hypothetical protein